MSFKTYRLIFVAAFRLAALLPLRYILDWLAVLAMLALGVSFALPNYYSGEFSAGRFIFAMLVFLLGSGYARRTL